MRKLIIIGCVAAFAVAGIAQEPLQAGRQRQLLADTALIETLSGGAALRLHEPVPREIALLHDAPWEGNSCGYHTVFQDGPRYRMYYRGYEQTLKSEPEPHVMCVCYAESMDGIHWNKPVLNLAEFNGSSANNILMTGEAGHNFTPFKDTNPACAPEAQYKAVALAGPGLKAFRSADGLHWTPLREEPIITQGAFDSQNLVFWDAVRGEYRAYWRDFHDGLRDIRTATSNDFVTWSAPVWLSYPGSPAEQLYTNQVIPYYRAPQLFVGFPTRYIDRGWSEAMQRLPEPEHRRLRSETSAREGTALTDGLFMISRDGAAFHRWDRVFIRPGLRTAGNWVYGDNYQAWGIVETASAIENAPRELSVYATESYWTGKSCALRQYTLRIDGFVSLEAGQGGGELITKPLVFEGATLSLNFATSAAGAIRVEIQHADGTPAEGFSLADCPESFGDTLDYPVSWNGKTDLSALAGTAVRLRFVMKDADLYSFVFE